MPKTTYLGRKAVSLQNDTLRLTVTEEGGHIAEVFHKAAGVNPLWTPHWTTGEPSEFGPAQEAIFGEGVEAKLLFGILGHNLCLDLFGGPSEAEAAAGMTAHGEGSVLRYDIDERDNVMVCRVHMPLAQIDFKRTLTLQGEDILVHETVQNLTAFDRPLAWTQHVTLSPPFLDPETTEFRTTGMRGVVVETDLGEAPYLAGGAEFQWPYAPLADGSGTADLRKMKAAAPASSYTAVAMQPGETGWTAWSPHYRLAISYAWQAGEFPWLGIWEENRSRQFKPWLGNGITRGMEFGTSPFPESRHAMIERRQTLNLPGYAWMPAYAKLSATYEIRMRRADRLPT